MPQGSSLFIPLHNSIPCRGQLLRRELLLEVGNNAKNLGHSAADYLVATPGTAFRTGQLRPRRMLGQRCLDALIGPNACLLGNGDHLQGRATGSQSFHRPQPLRAVRVPLLPFAEGREALLQILLAKQSLSPHGKPLRRSGIMSVQLLPWPWPRKTDTLLTLVCDNHDGGRDGHPVRILRIGNQVYD
jgi:hypothetical protein